MQAGRHQAQKAEERRLYCVSQPGFHLPAPPSKFPHILAGIQAGFSHLTSTGLLSSCFLAPLLSGLGRQPPAARSKIKPLVQCPIVSIIKVAGGGALAGMYTVSKGQKTEQHVCLRRSSLAPEGEMNGKRALGQGTGDNSWNHRGFFLKEKRVFGWDAKF